MNDWFVRTLNEFPSLSVLERKVETICAAILEEHGNVTERYVEPEDRREFSLSPPGNCFEELILARVKQEEELLPSIEPLPANYTPGESGNAGRPEALATFLNESQSRRDEYLRVAGAQNSIDQQEGEDEQRQQAASSQIPIQMLVS
ncbi:unnamed protein product [Peronospora destructor]|nr:unnamed protein product [Peronospora destructor]